MAVEYDLTCAGDTPVNQLAERALPDPDERPTGTAPLLSAALDDRYGFGATILAGTNGYVEALSDDGTWEWEPESYVLLGFRLNKDVDRSWAVINMLTVVRRVLDSGPEDAALVLNGDVLLFTRCDGVLVKHHRNDWWSRYPGAHNVIPE